MPTRFGFQFRVLSIQNTIPPFFVSGMVFCIDNTCNGTPSLVGAQETVVHTASGKNRPRESRCPLPECSSIVSSRTLQPSTCTGKIPARSSEQPTKSFEFVVFSRKQNLWRRKKASKIQDFSQIISDASLFLAMLFRCFAHMPDISRSVPQSYKHTGVFPFEPLQMKKLLSGERPKPTVTDAALVEQVVEMTSAQLKKLENLVKSIKQPFQRSSPESAAQLIRLLRLNIHRSWVRSRN